MSERPKFAVIDPRLEKCARITTDKPYAACVKRNGEHLEAPNQTVAPTARYVGRGEALVTEDIFGGTIEGNGLRGKTRVCVPGEKKNPIGCRVELDFPTPEELDQHNLPPGTPAVLRKCITKKAEGELVPVSTIDEALHASRAFCDCVGTKFEDGRRRKCARHT